VRKVRRVGLVLSFEFLVLSSEKKEICHKYSKARRKFSTMIDTAFFFATKSERHEVIYVFIIIATEGCRSGER
jgi:hypothetical protein